MNEYDNMTIFEKVSNEINNCNCDVLRENVIYWVEGDKLATVNFINSNRYASRLRKLAKDFPEECKVFSDKKGVITGAVPVKAIKMNIIKNERELTEEELERKKISLQKARETRKAQREERQNLSDIGNTPQ